MNIKFLSRQIEKSSGGTETVIAWNGTKEEMEELFSSEAINTLGDEGRLRNIRLFQESANIWCCEKKYSADASGSTPSDKPMTVYGKKSATLKGSMLSMPLESHPKYKTCWNYYLAIAPGVTGGTPSWWQTAKDTLISASDKYAWIKSLSELPTDTRGRWTIQKQPLKPGVETYDIATYSVTETAKHKSANAAGKAAAGFLNSIGFPVNTFGISGGNWKCDDASIFFDGADWFSTTTWTLSGDKNGWDKDLYS